MQFETDPDNLTVGLMILDETEVVVLECAALQHLVALALRKFSDEPNDKSVFVAAQILDPVRNSETVQIRGKTRDFEVLARIVQDFKPRLGVQYADTAKDMYTDFRSAGTILGSNENYIGSILSGATIDEIVLTMQVPDSPSGLS